MDCKVAGYIILRKAVQDLDKILDFVSKDSSDTARKQLGKIISKFESLVEFPNSGGDLKNKVSFKTKYRYYVLKPYIIIYKIENKHIVIARIFDARQDYQSILFNDLNYSTPLE